jgi:hypothetical protein
VDTPEMRAWMAGYIHDVDAERDLHWAQWGVLGFGCGRWEQVSDERKIVEWLFPLSWWE